MTGIVLNRDATFENAFHKIAAMDMFAPHIKDIVNAILGEEFSVEKIDKILAMHSIEKISGIKVELLDLLLLYISYILEDSVVAEKELFNLRILKRVFRIHQQDFFKYRRESVKRLLNSQFQKIYEDDYVDNKEALLKVGLQELFDLSYDQFQELSSDEVKAALNRGANLNDLDAVIKLGSTQEE